MVYTESFPKRLEYVCGNQLNAVEHQVEYKAETLASLYTEAIIY